MFNKKNIIVFLINLWFLSLVSAQSDKKEIIVKAIVFDKDTFPYVELSEVDVWTIWGKVYNNPKLYTEWSRIKYNVKKVYPYAILASAILKQMDNELAKIKNEKERKVFIKRCERQLKQQFEEELKDLSTNQGRILMKLINRETGKTTYQIVKEMRGGFEATMWQALAFIFGNSMKTTYNPNNEDVMIEKAIQLVENGCF